MNDRNVTTLTLASVLQNTDFLNYALGGDREKAERWVVFVKSHPECRDVSDRALDVVDHLDRPSDVLSESELADLREHVARTLSV